MSKNTILVDMDGVIADFERGFLKVWLKTYPNLNYTPIKNRRNYYIIDDYPKSLQKNVEDIYLSKGFYLNLPSINGSLKSLEEMEQQDLNVYICTAPLINSRYCLLEKYLWIEKKLGKKWVNKIITTRDKTLLKADLLIDDKPEVNGVSKPSWEHIIFDAPYNQNIHDKKRITWKNWAKIL